VTVTDRNGKPIEVGDIVEFVCGRDVTAVVNGYVARGSLMPTLLFVAWVNNGEYKTAEVFGCEVVLVERKK
jgi:hypothetical protein